MEHVDGCRKNFIHQLNLISLKNFDLAVSEILVVTLIMRESVVANVNIIDSYLKKYLVFHFLQSSVFP